MRSFSTPATADWKASVPQWLPEMSLIPRKDAQLPTLPSARRVISLLRLRYEAKRQQPNKL